MVRQKAKAKDSSNINGYVAQPTPRQQHSGNWTSDSYMHRNFYNNSMPATRSTQYLPTMPEYWRNICNNWVGALPRAAAPTPPAASSKKLARLRRELMNRPNVRHTNHILQTQSQPHCPNVNYCPPQWRGNAADANVYLRNSEQRTQAGTTRACQSNCSRLVYVNSCPMPNAHQETQRLPKQRKNLYNSFNFGKCASSIIGFCPDATTDSEGRSLAPIAQTQEAQNADAAAEFVPVSKLNNGTATDIEEALSYERYIFGHSAEQEELNLNEQWQPNQEITPETVISAAEPQVISIPAKRRKKSTRPKKQQQYEKNANRENSKAASSDEQELSVLRQLSQLMSNMSDTQMQPKSSEAQLESMPRQVNLNKLFQENNVKGLESNPLWDSLMQIVVRMCSDETEEHNVNKSEADKRERLSAGCDTERQQKQYSIYLVVSSDDENENDEPINEPQRVERHTQYESNYGDGDNNFGNSQLSQSSIKSNDYNNTKEPIKGRCSLCNHECGNALPKKRRFKKRKTATYGDSHKTRPPLHWPKPEYSKVKSHALQVLRNRCGTKLHKSSASAHWSTWDIHAKLPYELRRAYSQVVTTTLSRKSLNKRRIKSRQSYF